MGHACAPVPLGKHFADEKFSTPVFTTTVRCKIFFTHSSEVLKLHASYGKTILSKLGVGFATVLPSPVR